MHVPDSDTAPSYVRDVVFPSGYVSHQAPARLAYAAATRDVVPPDPTAPFSYFDLGCGNGSTLNALAAGNPHGHFIGVDFNAQHIELARQEAGAAGLDNVVYHEAPFSELAGLDLPTFDMAAINGAWSWLPPDDITCVVACVGDRLRPGGLFYVNWMTLPAKAAIAPIWEMLRRFSQGISDPVERARVGLATIAKLRRGGAEFFTHNPWVQRRLDGIIDRVERDPGHLRWLAHQALALHWRPWFFHEVVERLRPAGLTHLCSADPARADDEWTIPASLLPLVAEADADQVELLRDVILDQHERVDVFVRDPQRDAEAARRYRHERLHLLCRVPPAAVRRALRLPGGRSFSLATPQHLALAKAFEDGPIAVAALPADVAGDDPEALDRRVRQLVASGQLFSCMSADRPTPAEPPGRLAIPLPYNRVSFERASTVGGTIAVSALVGGGSVPVSAAEAALLLAMTGRDEVADADLVSAAGARLRSETTSPVAQITDAQLGTTLAQLRARKLLNLYRLGVVTAAESSPTTS